MKPSERIKQIITELERVYPNYIDNPLKAVLDYLDEEYERNKTPEQRQKEKERYWNS